MPKRRNGLKVVGGWLDILVALPIVSIAGTLVWLTTTGHLLSVMSGSMAPTFRQGDAVIVMPSAPAKIGVGQIISYRSSFNPKLIISHRLIAINAAAQTVTTKGDALAQADPPISRGQITGRVVAVAPGLGRLTSFVRRPLGLITLIYLPALMVLINDVWRLVKVYRRPVYRLAGYR